MRSARIKISGSPAYYHVGNHVCGSLDSLPFTSEDKEQGFRLLDKIGQLFFIEVISACWMGNHFHVVLYVPPKPPPIDQVVDKYNGYYKKHSRYHSFIDPAENLKKCKQIAEKLIDISEFMKMFQQQFTMIFNKKHIRRGPLWRDRFWSAVLEGPKALWDCVKYVELNPVRACIVNDPGDYLQSSWGKYKQFGKHPFKKNFVLHMRKNRLYAVFNRPWTYDDDALISDFSDELDEILRREMSLDFDASNEKDRSIYRNGLLAIDRYLKRVKQWRNGKIIGSFNFVQSVAAKLDSSHKFSNKRCGRGKTKCGVMLFCLHQGRVHGPVDDARESELKKI